MAYRQNNQASTGGRPSYGSGSGGDYRPGGRSYDRDGGSGGEKEYIRKVRAVKSLGDIGIEEIAKEDGIAEQAAKSFRELKTTQLRRVFDAVKKIESELTDKPWVDIEADFHMLRPALAYAKGRDLIPDDFYTLVTTAMQKVPVGDDDQKKKNYRIFVKLLESIVAYHKYHHGK